MAVVAAISSTLSLPSSAVEPKKGLQIADLGQPETNPWVINRHRFERCVADALGVKLNEFDDQNSEEKHISQAESIIASQPDGVVFNPLTSPRVCKLHVYSSEIKPWCRCRSFGCQ